MNPAVAIAALFLSGALPLHASCVFNLRYDKGILRWDPIAVATRYRVTEELENQTNYYVTRDSFVAVSRRASSPLAVEYTVTADLQSGVRNLAEKSMDSCSAALTTMVAVDPEFRKLTRKAILPVVASTAGANGGRFRTSMTLRGSPLLRGRLVFHPAGKSASDDDPSIRYAFDLASELRFDDVVTAIGGSGVGSIDIIPDDDSRDRIPEVWTYLFNETPNGTFGTFAAPAFPYEYLQAASHSLTIPDARFRVNTGFRTLTDTTIRVTIHGVDGRLRAFHDVSFPAGWMQMTSAAELARSTLVPGETLSMLFIQGAVIAFHTLTENATNDPTLVMAAPAGRRGNLDEYVE